MFFVSHVHVSFWGIILWPLGTMAGVFPCGGGWHLESVYLDFHDKDVESHDDLFGEHFRVRSLNIKREREIYIYTEYTSTFQRVPIKP